MTRARGFTLVELMVSMGLFGLIAAGAMSLVLSANRLQQYSSRVDVAQSSARAGLELIGRDLLSACTGASSGSFYDSTTSTIIATPIKVTDNVTASGNTDVLDLYLADTRLYGTVVQAVAGGAGTIFVDSAGAFTSATTPFYALVTDLQTPTIVKVSAASSTSIGTVAAQLLTLSGSLSLPSTVSGYAAGAMVFKLRHVTYSVSTTKLTSASAVNQDSLLMIDLNDGNGPQPLAEGVEDFQVALGFDNDGDGVVTESGLVAGDDEVVFNVAGETMPASLGNLKWVRISLVAKATQAEAGSLGKPLAVEDHLPAASVDGFPRRIVRSEISVRNFNL